ncbi:MAG: ABC transporter permease [Anaerolineales bacterium]|nr:ABC transporter permease [Anaerolineales bacterium]
MQPIWVVFQKEVVDNLRDRRTLGSAIFGALLGPLLILLLIIILGQAFFKEAGDKALVLPVIGAEHAPNLVQFLEQQNATLVPGPADPETAVRNGDVELVLVIPEDYPADFGAGQPAAVQIVADSSRQSASLAVNRTRSLLDAYSRQISALRLVARGVSPAVIQPLTVQNVDTATPQSQVLIFLNALPYFLMFALFSGGAGVIIDSTAGERERGSLEPLLINPATRRAVVLGKLLAALPFAGGVLLITLAAYAVIFNLIPLEDFIGFRLSIDPLALASIFLVCLPMIVLASALQMIIATFARNFKEAQTYVGFLPLIPALPGLGLAFIPLKAELWTMLIPTFGQQLLINQLMRAEPISTVNVLISAVVTLLLAILLIGVSIRLYEREQIVLAR